MRRIVALSSILVTLGASCVFGQMKIAGGIVLGGSYNIHTGSILQKRGVGVGFVGGGQIDLSFTKYVGLLTTVYAYDNRIGEYNRTETQGGIDYSLDLSVTVVYAEIEPLLKITMPDYRFYFVVGPIIGFMEQGKSDVTTTITTPGYSFENGYSYQVTTSELTNVSTRYELTVGGGYSYIMDGQSRLTTQLSFGYGLNTIQKNVDWRINSVRLMVGLEFDMFQ